MKPVVEEELHFLDFKEDLSPFIVLDLGGRVFEKFLEDYRTRLFATKVSIWTSIM
jgi:hypothetical protein